MKALQSILAGQIALTELGAEKMDLPIQDENWSQNLRAYGEHGKKKLDSNNEPCLIGRWYYDKEKTRKKS